MSAMTSAEAMALSTALVAAHVEDDTSVPRSLLATMEAAELRTLVVATSRLAAAMLEEEAEDTDADPEAPAARTFRLFAQAVRAQD